MNKAGVHTFIHKVQQLFGKDTNEKEKVVSNEKHDSDTTRLGHGMLTDRKAQGSRRAYTHLPQKKC